MSLGSMVWALGQQVPKSSTKFLLVALANYAGPNGECYPSIPRLSMDTAQNEKTVRRNLRELVRLNMICDTGRRVGRTKQIPIYILACHAEQYLNPTKNGSLPVSEPYQKRLPNPTKNDLRTLPKTVPRTKSFNQKQQEPVLQRRKAEVQNAIGLHHIGEILGMLK